MNDTELIERVTSEFPGKILHTAEVGGVVAVVEDRNGTIFYHAREFTLNDEQSEECGGYSTSDRYYYMGERYRSPLLWGKHFSEVYK